MNNSIDFIAKVYETLAGIFNFSSAPPGLFMQMAWPGIPIVSNDFKNASGNVDPNVAEEVFSEIANMAPIFDKNKFEDSAFDIDSLYEIILASARPSGIPNSDLETNPMFKMFADAQYEYLRNEKGSVSDPTQFYHPCKATPSNWYEDSASQFWPKIDLKSSDILKSSDNNPFIKNIGVKNIEKSVWKLNPSSSLKNTLSNSISSKISNEENAVKVKFDTFSLKPKTNPISGNVLMNRNLTGLNTVKPLNTISPLSNKVVETKTLLSGSKNIPQIDLLSRESFKTAFVKSMAQKPISISTPVNKYKQSQVLLNQVDLNLVNKNLFLDNKLVPIKNRIMLENIIKSQLPSSPASTESNNFSVSFNFCRVSIDRPWLNLGLLRLPNWYIYDTNSNLFSNGSADSNTGIFPLLTTSFIVIKNLKITANWSDIDKNNISNGISFGPFDIRKGILNQNTLEISGMQIIAFISKVMPPLAPNNPV